MASDLTRGPMKCTSSSSQDRRQMFECIVPRVSIFFDVCFSCTCQSLGVNETIVLKGWCRVSMKRLFLVPPKRLCRNDCFVFCRNDCVETILSYVIETIMSKRLFRVLSKRLYRNDYIVCHRNDCVETIISCVVETIVSKRLLCVSSKRLYRTDYIVCHRNDYIVCLATIMSHHVSTKAKKSSGWIHRLTRELEMLGFVLVFMKWDSQSAISCWQIRESATWCKYSRIQRVTRTACQHLRAIWRINRVACSIRVPVTATACLPVAWRCEHGNSKHADQLYIWAVLAFMCRIARRWVSPMRTSNSEPDTCAVRVRGNKLPQKDRRILERDLPPGCQVSYIPSSEKWDWRNAACQQQRQYCAALSTGWDASYHVRSECTSKVPCNTLCLYSIRGGKSLSTGATAALRL